MQLTVLSFEPAQNAQKLAPAPSARDCDDIAAALKGRQEPAITDLMAQPIEILANYRAHMLYCNGGVCVHRDDPQTVGGHGFAGMPYAGLEESVLISCASGRFRAKVRFE